MPEPMFFAQTANEILGLFSPAEGSTVSFGTDVPPEAIAAHENGHRMLCAATSVGCYISALAVMAGHAEDPATRDTAKRLCIEASRQCWMVQEGFATFRQFDEYRKLERYDLIAVGAGQLPRSYQTALGLFWFEPNEHELRDLQRALRGSPADARNLADLTNERMALILAAAAMGVPLSGAMAASDVFPSLAISGALRRNAPDSRIEALIPSFTPEFRNRCRVRVIAAVRHSAREGTTRLVDEEIHASAAELCQIAGLDYERSDRISIADLFTKAGCRNVVQEFDGRDARIDMMADQFNDHAFIAGTDLGFAISAPISHAQALELAAMIWAGPPAHMVCEIGTPDAYGGVIAFLHCFRTRQGYLEGLDPADHASIGPELATLHPEVAVNLGLIAISADPHEGADRLLADFPHATWDWIASPDILRLHSRRWAIDRLARSAPVTSIAFHPRQIQPVPAEDVLIVPPFFAGASAFATSGYQNLEALPDNLRIAFYPTQDPDYGGCRRARLFMRPTRAQERVSHPRFREACIASSLYQGFYSQIARIRGAREG